jgi:diguanylate cyclase (GGDEF)-like protein
MPKNKTILVVDDTVSNLDILLDLLAPYDAIEVTNGKEALEVVHKEPIDLILLDIMMPHMDGYEVCKRLKENPQTQNIPIIFITAKTDEDSIEKAYDVGGSDYITKPFRPKELLARVKRELKLQELQQKLELLASTDPLTNLYNRRYFQETATNLFALAKRETKEISFIMVDIDKFKNINDTYGHDVGDTVLQTLAKKLLLHHRKSDIVCRYGGEEFFIMLPNTSLKSAVTLAQIMRKDVADLKFNIADTTLRFTISLGVSQTDIAQEIDIEKALKRADEALYDAKESGRNRVCSRDK